MPYAIDLNSSRRQEKGDGCDNASLKSLPCKVADVDVCSNDIARLILPGGRLDGN